MLVMRPNLLIENQVLCGLDDIRVSEGIEAATSSSEGRSSDSDGEKYRGKTDYDAGKSGLGAEQTVR